MSATLAISVAVPSVCAAVAAWLGRRDRDAGLALGAALLALIAIQPLADRPAGWPDLAGALIAAGTFLVILRGRRGRVARDTALRRSESWLRTLADSIPDFLVVSDPDGTVRWVNRTVPSLTPAAVIGRDVLEFVAPAQRRRVREAYGRARDEQATSTYNVEFTAGDRTLWFETRVSPIVVDGRVVQILASATDVTERRRLEAQLARSRRLDSLGTLAGGVAHDFNNLVTAILGSADLARRAAADVDDVEARRRIDAAVDRIENASERASGLTRQLLAFGRRQAGREQVVDVDAVVSGMEDLLRGLVGEAARLDLRLGSGIANVRIDPAHLEQIVIQLVANARDAIGERGTVTLATVPVEIDAGYCERNPEARPGPKLVLRVSDDGIGMDRSTLARLFDPFFTTKAVGRGTGLGLAAAYGLVTQAGGHVEVDSAPGEGSTFRVFLPAVQDRATVATWPDRGTAPGPAAGSGETVLVCEDDALVREATCGSLRSHGYRVLEAADAETALELAASHDGPIDLLLTDLLLPGMDGRELAERLTLRWPDVPVLFVSGRGPDLARIDDVRVEVREFLEKPFTPATLLPRIRALLDRETS